MAIDQTSSTSPPESSAIPAIDNEFPTYRAVSSSAVLSMVFGVGSVFCYASLWFLFMAGGAILLGLHSLKKIRQLPEVFTGSGLARIGIGIAILFGATSITRVLTQDLFINYDAGKFAKFYAGVIKDKPVSEALWYQQTLAYRNAKDPDALVQEMKQSKSQSGGDVYQSNAAPIVEMKERLDGGKGGEMTYVGIETRAIDGLTTYANALVKLDVKPTKEHPETELYALFHMIKGPDDWMVKTVSFPYTPKSVVATVESKSHDDGHGH